MSNRDRTHDVVVTRTMDAPRERVWQAWSDPDLVMTWWGPRGFTAPVCRMDFREGGTTLVSMRSDEGSFPSRRAPAPASAAAGANSGTGRERASFVPPLDSEWDTPAFQRRSQ